MEISRIHICIEVAHLETSLEFYEPLMGAAGFEIQRVEGLRYAFFNKGEIGFAVGESQPRRVHREKPKGDEFVVTDHLGFSVGERSDLQILANVMAEKGIAPLFPLKEYPEFGAAFCSICFCDPDNHVIEFCHKPE